MEQYKKLLHIFKGKKSVGTSRADVDRLVQQVFTLIEPLKYSSRVKCAVLLGQASCGVENLSSQFESYIGGEIDQSSCEAIANFLTALQEGDFQERYFSLLSCSGSLDGKHVLIALKDRSKILRCAALAMCAQILDDEDLQVAFSQLDLVKKKRLLLNLRKRKRFAVCDRLILGFIDSQSPRGEIVEILPFAGKLLIEESWAEYEDSAGSREWIKLARIHPELAISLLMERVSELEYQDPRLLGFANSVLSVCASTATDSGIKLIKALLRLHPLSALVYSNFIKYRPVQIAELILKSDVRLPFNLSSFFHKLDDNSVVEAVGRLNSGTSGYVHNYSIWLRKLTSQLRARLFEEYQDAWRDANGAIPISILDTMPNSIRVKQAKSHLDMEQLKTSPWLRLPYAQFLGYHQCIEVLGSYLSDPDPEIRCQAVKPLINSVKFDRKSTSELLAFLESRPNEPDPVRLASLLTVSNLPPGIWREEHLEMLGKVVRDSLNAKDLSYASLSYLQALCVRLIPFHLEWSGSWLATILKERNTVQLGYIVDRVNEKQASQLGAILMPVLSSLKKQEKEQAILNLAASFGIRLRAFDKLTDMVEELVIDGSNSSICQQALTIIFNHRFDRLKELIPKILRKDPTWSQVYLVSNYLNQVRQDLLTPYLGQRAYRGKFATGKVRVVPRFWSGFQRWSREQRQTYAKSLESLCEGREDRSVGDVFMALSGLSMLPDASNEVLLKYARLKDEDKSAMRDHAIQCISRLDNGSGVAELLECLSDERARVAIYVLRDAMLDMESEEALTILGNAPRRQITVAKEIVRLIGELRTESSFETLVEISQSQLHRDVKIALFRAFWNYLDREKTWQLMQEASIDSDRSIALHMVRIPTERIARSAEDSLVSLLANLLGSNDSMVRLAVLQRLSAMPVNDGDYQLLSGISDSLASSSGSESSAAAGALVVTYGFRDVEVVEEAVEKVLSNRRIVNSLTSYMIAYFQNYGQKGLPAIRAVLKAFSRDRLTISRQLHLVCETLPFEEVITFIRELHKKSDLHADALSAVIQSFDRASRRADADMLHIVEKAFFKEESEVLRRIALAALCALSGASQGWTKERLERLELYRQDVSSLVAEAAQFTLPSAELVVASATG